MDSLSWIVAVVLVCVPGWIGAEIEYEGTPPDQVVTLALVNQTADGVFVNVLQDQGTHRLVELAQHAHHVFGLGRLGEAGEATQVDEDDADVAAMRL